MLNHHHHHQLYVDDFDCHSSMLSACLLYIQSTSAHSDKDLLIDLECIIDYTTHALDYAINNRITQHTKHAHITCLCLLNIICVAQHLFVWRQGVPISYVCIHAFINMHWILSCACMLFPSSLRVLQSARVQRVYICLTYSQACVHTVHPALCNLYLPPHVHSWYRAASQPMLWAIVQWIFQSVQ